MLPRKNQSELLKSLCPSSKSHNANNKQNRQRRTKRKLCASKTLKTLASPLSEPSWFLLRTTSTWRSLRSVWKTLLWSLFHGYLRTTHFVGSSQLTHRSKICLIKAKHLSIISYLRLWLLMLLSTLVMRFNRLSQDSHFFRRWGGLCVQPVKAHAPLWVDVFQLFWLMHFESFSAIRCYTAFLIMGIHVCGIPL